MLPTFTTEQSEALARGWPHVITLVDSAVEPVPLAVELLKRVDSKSVRWSRPLAEAYVRGHGVGAGKPSGKALAAMEGPPLDAAAFAELLPLWLRRDRYRFQWTWLLLAAEALIGPDAVVDGVVDLFAGFTTRRWTAERPAMLFKRALTSPAYLGYAVGFPLLRAGADRRAALAAVAERGPEGSSGRVALELALHGATAAQAHGIDLLAALHFADDQPDYLRSCSAHARLDASLSPRFAWLGGTPVLKDFARRFDTRVPPHQASELVGQFGVFATPEVLPVMLALVRASRSRRKALAWFDAHEGFAAEHEAVWRDLEGADRVRRGP